MVFWFFRPHQSAAARWRIRSGGHHARSERRSCRRLSAASIVENDFPKSPRLSLRSNHDEPIERGYRSNGYTNENLIIMRCNKVYKRISIQIAQSAEWRLLGGATSLRLHHVRT